MDDIKEYYAVIFSSDHSGEDNEGYAAMSARMIELASREPGFLGVESARNEDGFGITVSYWIDEKSIRDWKTNVEHLAAQKSGREKWYKHFRVRIAKVCREYHCESRSSFSARMSTFDQREGTTKHT